MATGHPFWQPSRFSPEGFTPWHRRCAFERRPVYWGVRLPGPANRILARNLRLHVSAWRFIVDSAFTTKGRLGTVKRSNHPQSRFESRNNALPVAVGRGVITTSDKVRSLRGGHCVERSAVMRNVSKSAPRKLTPKQRALIDAALRPDPVTPEKLMVNVLEWFTALPEAEQERILDEHARAKQLKN